MKYMARMKTEGIDEYVRKLEAVGRGTVGAIRHAVYEGAGVAVQAVDRAIDTIPTSNGKYIPGDLPIYGLSAKQKAGLHRGLGLAKMRDDNGYINTKIGFDGYNDVETARYPNGQPNALIARAVESGTSRRPKYRFVAKALKQATPECERKMAKALETSINKTMEG